MSLGVSEFTTTTLGFGLDFPGEMLRVSIFRSEPTFDCPTGRLGTGFAASTATSSFASDCGSWASTGSLSAESILFVSTFSSFFSSGPSCDSCLTGALVLLVSFGCSSFSRPSDSSDVKRALSVASFSSSSFSSRPVNSSSDSTLVLLVSSLGSALSFDSCLDTSGDTTTGLSSMLSLLSSCIFLHESGLRVFILGDKAAELVEVFKLSFNSGSLLLSLLLLFLVVIISPPSKLRLLAMVVMKSAGSSEEEEAGVKLVMEARRPNLVLRLLLL
mmetsp:Transcript_22661/g.63027  ORF Transcript_22661/g.63027 Transcript_22661/m.63027 type:complete len:273 (+) Transcript_22661:1270-2088(+)